MYLDNNRNTMPPAADTPWNYLSPNEPLIPDNPRKPIVYYLGPYLSVPNADMSNLNEFLQSNGTKGAKCFAKVLCCPGDKRDGVSKYYFKIQQSSYWYNGRLGGRLLDRTAFRSYSALKDMEAMGDYDSFHGPKQTATAGSRYDESTVPPVGAYNYLFADCHVGDRKGM
jgi:prepilin-type processing-associated H-X9-DG protein